MAAGTQIGSFHPLVAFADTERAVAALHGATVAIEADDQLADLLGRMAEAIGATPVRLAPGSKAAYHAAAVLAAGGFVALLDAIADARTGGRARRGRLPGHLRAADRRDAGQCPGPRHRGGTDRTDHPRRRRHAPRPPRRVARRTPQACWTCTWPPGVARSSSPPGAWRAGTGDGNGYARNADGRACAARLNGYHCGPWTTASPPSTRPVRRPDSCVRPTGFANADWAFDRPIRSVPRALDRPCFMVPTSPRSPGFAPARDRSSPPIPWRNTAVSWVRGW